MATSIVLAPNNTSTLALYVASGRIISDFLQSNGWVKTPDTGQINWNTLASVVAGFEVFAPTDALQTGASQFFLRIDYTISGNTLFVTYKLGTGTNGAGTLTGFVTTMSFNAPGTIGTSNYESDLSAASNRFTAIMWRTQFNGVSHAVMIERFKDTSGNDTAAGVTLAFAGNSVLAQQSIVFGVGLSQLTNALVVLGPGTSSTTGVLNLNVPISPVFPYIGTFGNPHIGFGSGRTSDFTEGTLYTPAPIYGVSHTYFASKAGSLTSVGPGNTGNAAALVLFE